jgi:lipopolysaccharide export LptBFGC system permease protein LptF
MDPTAPKNGDGPLPTIDINTIQLASLLSNNQQTNISIKSEPTPEEAEHRRRKDNLQTYFSLVLIAIVLAFLFLAIVRGSPDDKRWSMTIVGVIVGYAVRHVFGGGSSS